MKLHLIAELALSITFITPSVAYLTDPPSTASPDTIQDCSSWQVAAAEDTCASIAKAWSITISQFATYNPSIASQCKLVVGNSYCVEQNWGIPPVPTSTVATSVTPTPTKPTNGVITPTPIQSGMVDNCNQFYYVVQDDGCFDIAAKFGITTDQFYTWNPFIQDTCKNLWPKTYVCVGLIGMTPSPKPSTTPTPSKTVSSSAKTTPTNGISTPSPVQTGMVSNCNRFYLVKQDDGCWAIANANGITTDQFNLWNPAVGVDCKNLFPNTYVCIGIVGMSPPTLTKTSVKPSSTVRPTSTKAGNGIATPTPIQDGMTPNCKKFYKVVKDDGCWAIANANKIDLNDFYKWNPAVGTDCKGLWPDTYVCIGV